MSESFTLCRRTGKGEQCFQDYRKMTLKETCNTALAGYLAQMRTCQITDLACINRYMTTSESALSARVERQLEMLHSLPTRNGAMDIAKSHWVRATSVT